MTKDEALWALRERVPVKMSSALAKHYWLVAAFMPLGRIERICHSLTENDGTIEESDTIRVEFGATGIFGGLEDFQIAFPEGAPTMKNNGNGGTP